MGYRPNIVKRYEVEYGSEIGGFNLRSARAR